MLYNIIKKEEFIMIYIIALGNENYDISLRGLQTLKKIGNIHLRSCMLKSSQFLESRGFSYTTFDKLYEEIEDFDLLNKKIYDFLKSSSEDSDLCYLVDGCGLEDRVAAKLIKEGAKLLSAPAKGINCLAKFPRRRYLSISASDFITQKNLSQTAILIYEIDSYEKASDVKLKIMKDFGDEISVIFYDGNTTQKLKAYEIDSFQRFSYDISCLVSPKSLKEKSKFSLSDLFEIMEILRSENGCPWDKVQTHESLKSSFVEEVYEAVEAIDLDDPFLLEEELGDVLLQIVHHSQIAKEEGTFDIDDVTTGICRKLISRHSHVFGTDVAPNPESALETWEQNKNVEKNLTSFTETLKAVPKTFPALMKAQKIQKRAAKAGFDWTNTSEIFAKINEEMLELTEAVQNDTNIAEELGDVLFVLTNLARHLGLDSEEVLNLSSEKFVSRFQIMENLAKEKQLDMKTLPPDKYNELYLKAKSLHNEMLSEDELE